MPLDLLFPLAAITCPRLIRTYSEESQRRRRPPQRRNHKPSLTAPWQSRRGYEKATADHALHPSLGAQGATVPALREFMVSWARGHTHQAFSTRENGRCVPRATKPWRKGGLAGQGGDTCRERICRVRGPLSFNLTSAQALGPPQVTQPAWDRTHLRISS